MTRVIIKLKDGTFINIKADCIDIRDGWIMAWNGEFVVAIVKDDEVVSCHISEQKC